MVTLAEKIQRLQDCIALLQDVDAMQQTALDESDVCYENHNRIQGLIEDFAEDIKDLKSA